MVVKTTLLSGGTILYPTLMISHHINMILLSFEPIYAVVTR